MQIIRMQPEFQIRDMVLNDEILDFGKLIINPLKRNAQKNGQEIKLTLYEFEILYLLAKNPGWVFSKAQIIYNMRSKMEDDRKRPFYILTVRGFGYKFNPHRTMEVKKHLGEKPECFSYAPQNTALRAGRK